MHTDAPAAARYAAQTSPLCPPPMTTTSNSGADTNATRGSFVRETGRDRREAAIDVCELAGDRGRQIRERKGGDVAGVGERDVAPQQVRLCGGLEERGETAATRGRECFDR